ncbi:GIY-YIG nuclease family protein [Endothiovibrio diazotrophicus]
MSEANGGAYRLVLRLDRAVRVTPGRLGERRLRRGSYLYLGSAKRGLEQRVARHRRLAEEKTGRLHWHIDYLLTHPDVRLIRIDRIVGGDECVLSREVAARAGSEPVVGFGATDCRRGCPAHLYRVARIPPRIIHETSATTPL